MLTTSGRKTAPPDIMFTRMFQASLQLVFSAWTDEKKVASWWGPYGFTNPVCNWNARVNGSIYIDMTAPDGMVFPMTGRFHEIQPPNKLVFTSRAFEDDDGKPQLEVVNTVTLSEENGSTKFVLQTHIVKATPVVKESLEGMQEGWSQSLDKLNEYLKANSYEK
jgi:uncharacterized protein YndB with AHSA1/START domain